MTPPPGRFDLRYRRRDLWLWRFTRPATLAAVVAVGLLVALLIATIGGDDPDVTSPTTEPATTGSAGQADPADTAPWIAPPDHLAVELDDRYGAGGAVYWWDDSPSSAATAGKSWDDWDLEVETRGALVLQDPEPFPASGVPIGDLAPGAYIVRVRRVAGSATSPWSTTTFSVAAPDDPVPAPSITQIGIDSGLVHVSWSIPEPFLAAVSVWTVQVRDADRVVAERQIVGAADATDTLTAALGPVPAGDYVLRVRVAITDTASFWTEQPITVGRSPASSGPGNSSSPGMSSAP